MKYILSVPIVIAIMVVVPCIWWLMSKAIGYVIDFLSQHFPGIDAGVIVLIVLVFVALYIIVITCPAWTTWR